MTLKHLQHDIPDIVIGRLPIYLRALQHLAQEGKELTNSDELGKHLGISSAQIRKDLSLFGGFGKQGAGYRIQYLQNKLYEVLNLQKEWEIALIGAGDLGRAVAHYKGFKERGFKISCIFDNDPHKVNQNIDGILIQPMENVATAIPQYAIKIAMIAVPATVAQEVADLLVAVGIRAILNYAPINLETPDGVFVQYIDPVTHLQRMTYYL